MNRKIKFDRAMMRLLTILTICSFLFFVLGLVLLLLEIEATALLAVSGLYIGGGVFIVCFLELIAGLFYIARLKKYGYEIPMNRKDYGYSLDHLPRKEINIDYNRRHKESLSIAILYILFFLIGIAINVYMLIYWKIIIQDVLVMSCFLSVVDLIWLVMGIIFFVQSNQHKYRDDVEADAKRKTRMSIETGIILLVVFLAISFCSKLISYNMLKYIFSSRADADQNIVCDIRDSISYVYSTYEDPKQVAEIDAMLQQGVIITDLPESAPVKNTESILWNDVINNLAVSNFTEVQQRFQLTDGPAEISVIMDGDNIRVQVNNPDSRIRTPLMAEGSKGERPVIQ